MKIITLLFLFVLTSCSMVRSSINYTQGTQCLESGDIDQAIPYLEEAVRLGPDHAKNHTNLAYAYKQKGDLEKVWITLRKSVLCKYPDASGPSNFIAIYVEYVAARGLDLPGTPRSEIVSKLGEPDMILSHGNQYVYGLCVMSFKDELLQDVSFLQ